MNRLSQPATYQPGLMQKNGPVGNRAEADFKGRRARPFWSGSRGSRQPYQAVLTRRMPTPHERSTPDARNDSCAAKLSMNLRSSISASICSSPGSTLAPMNSRRRRFAPNVVAMLSRSSRTLSSRCGPTFAYSLPYTPNSAVWWFVRESRAMQNEISA